MRFTLTLVSAAMLANMALAAPANPQQNSEIEVNGFNPAQTAALQLGEQFQPFNWKAEGEQKTVDRTFSLDLAEPAELQITDYKLGGDKYEILDNGVPLGMTSEANEDQGAFVGTPEEALADERFSHGNFQLAEGKHEITINVADSPYADGMGAVRVVQKLQEFGKKGDKKGGKKGGKKEWDDDEDDEWDGKKGGKKGGKKEWDDDEDDEWDGKKGGKKGGKKEWDDDEDDEWDSKKGGKKGGKKDWDEDEDDDWEDDDDKKGGWGDKKKGGWGDDKKGGWDDDKKGGWGDKKDGKDWDDDKKGGWGDKKGDWDDNKWDDDKKGGWGDKKGDWDDDKWDGDKWDDDKKGGWDDKKGGWDKKKTVYVYYTVPGDYAGLQREAFPEASVSAEPSGFREAALPTSVLTSTIGTTAIDAANAEQGAVIV
ncbi:hypothetical protein BCR43DRAFT_566186 [Syncephalastrum racemosum]|uniref:Uncharacterized protein n=1 Tax=Syncephalastrum racemosum TaxID=13706 RepID=A0A1X2H223_SYNRA|nr:hypothetical protein BCR43DRAFT_566186 [Syncephalastrum racemosum]